MSKHGPCESLVYNGERFRRYPESKNRELRVYFASQRGRTLHRAIWEDANGPIPDGWHIHHKDHNPLNNNLSNLEPKSPINHHAEHWTKERAEFARRNIKRISPLAKAWHRSAAGRAWHTEHGRDAWTKRTPIKRDCVQCGRAFEDIARRDTDRFCSNNCKSMWRRKSGVDDEDRICPICGKTFRINRYSRTKTCSSVCGGVHHSRTICSRVRH
ncbi:MAG: HNH endonuclease [Patescibacteria group bacterium]